MNVKSFSLFCGHSKAVPHSLVGPKRLNASKGASVNYRRIAAAAVMAWLVSIPLGAFIHHGILGSVYAADSTAFRPDVAIIRRLPIGYVAQMIGFLAAASMYAQVDSPRRGILQRLRFGLLLGVVVVSFAVIWNYVTQPISAIVGMAEVLEYMVAAMIYGAIISAICRPNRARVSLPGPAGTRVVQDSVDHR